MRYAQCWFVIALLAVAAVNGLNLMSVEAVYICKAEK